MFHLSVLFCVVAGATVHLHLNHRKLKEKGEAQEHQVNILNTRENSKNDIFLSICDKNSTYQIFLLAPAASDHIIICTFVLFCNENVNFSLIYH